jgi:enoyl-CoA hydratase/carnithine racemase
VKGIVLTSTDGSFAGADINELAALPTAEACERTCLDSHPIFERIARCAKPVVAAVDGPGAGRRRGAQSMACHARVVGKILSLGQPEVNLGIIPGYGGTQRLPRLIGVERAVGAVADGTAGRSEGGVRVGLGATASPPPTLSRPRRRSRARTPSGATQGRSRRSPASMRVRPMPRRSTSATARWRSTRSSSTSSSAASSGRSPRGCAIEAEGFARCKRPSIWTSG